MSVTIAIRYCSILTLPVVGCFLSGDSQRIDRAFIHIVGLVDTVPLGGSTAGVSVSAEASHVDKEASRVSFCLAAPFVPADHPRARDRLRCFSCRLMLQLCSCLIRSGRLLWGSYHCRHERDPTNRIQMLEMEISPNALLVWLVGSRFSQDQCPSAHTCSLRWRMSWSKSGGQISSSRASIWIPSVGSDGESAHDPKVKMRFCLASSCKPRPHESYAVVYRSVVVESSGRMHICIVTKAQEHAKCVKMPRIHCHTKSSK